MCSQHSCISFLRWNLACDIAEAEVINGLDPPSARNGRPLSWTSVTEIGYEAFKGHKKGLTIHAPAGSYTEQYAKENGIKFEIL